MVKIRLILLFMLCQMVSAIMLSQHVFAFLSISGFTAIGHKLHLLGAYWGFALMSLHLGLHWGMVMGVVRKALRASKSSSP